MDKLNELIEAGPDAVLQAIAAGSVSREDVTRRIYWQCVHDAYAKAHQERLNGRSDLAAGFIRNGRFILRMMATDETRA